MFKPLAEKEGAVWLDSTLRVGDKGRCSYIACHPVADISWNNGQIIQRGSDGIIRSAFPGDIFAVVEERISKTDLFAVGYITYEGALPFVGISPAAPHEIPSARFLLYDSAIRYDHRDETYGLVGKPFPGCEDPFGSATTLAEDDCPPPDDIIPAQSRSDYLERIERIKWHIHEGDLYQANFTTRFEVKTELPPFRAYTRLRSLNPAPYGAYLNFGDYRILSSSPERMYFRRRDIVTCCPIKGSIRRGHNSREEQENLRRLLESEKDRAELLMIVDLVRHDLGRIARTGTVSVDDLFQPEIYSSIIHLVSNVSAHLEPTTGNAAIVEALLPGGSISGAPKRRAIEFLRQLEPVPRSVYTGCIGYMHGDRADFNIAIRTLTHADSAYHVHAGGGIVADSQPELEYGEMLLKATNLFRALGIGRDQMPC